MSSDCLLSGNTISRVENLLETSKNQYFFLTIHLEYELFLYLLKGTKVEFEGQLYANLSSG